SPVNIPGWAPGMELDSLIALFKQLNADYDNSSLAHILQLLDEPSAAQTGTTAAALVSVTQAHDIAKAAIDAILDQMNAVLASGAPQEEIDKQVGVLKQYAAAWQNVATLYATISSEIATAARDAEQAAALAKEGWQLTLTDLAKNITDAKQAFADALLG